MFSNPISTLRAQGSIASAAHVAIQSDVKGPPFAQDIISPVELRTEVPQWLESFIARNTARKAMMYIEVLRSPASHF